jgi:hypothetical protein
VDNDFKARLERIAGEIELGMNCTLEFWQDRESDVGGRFYFQIACERLDVVTKVMGTGYSGKAYLSEFMTDSELVQTTFGLYKGYWEHEARETFEWRGRRVFGPHISTEALWDVALRTDARKPIPEPDRCAFEGRDGRCDLIARPGKITCEKHKRYENVPKEANRW